jgi:hypothetical protein
MADSTNRSVGEEIHFDQISRMSFKISMGQLVTFILAFIPTVITIFYVYHSYLDTVDTVNELKDQLVNFQERMPAIEERLKSQTQVIEILNSRFSDNSNISNE